MLVSHCNLSFFDSWKKILFNVNLNEITQESFRHMAEIINGNDRFDLKTIIISRLGEPGGGLCGGPWPSTFLPSKILFGNRFQFKNYILR